MKIYRFDQSCAREISSFESKGASIADIFRNAKEASIGCMYIQRGGNVGFHPAIESQLFLVVNGSGWVTGEDRVRKPISAGEAAFWAAGENHESGTDETMVAFVIEGLEIDPSCPLRG